MSESMNEKIKKLLRLAERAGTPAEGEAARGAAMRLMTKWGIEEAMLGDIAEKQEQIVTRFTEPFPKQFVKARTGIAGMIVKGMGNMRVWVQGNLVAVMGFESDVDRAMVFIPSILIQADRELLMWWKNYEHRLMLSSGEAMRAKRNFLFAFGATVQSRLVSMRQEEVAATSNAVGTALVLRDRDAMVEEKYRDDVAGRLSKPRRLKGSSHGTAAGREAGQRARLGGTAIGGASRGSLGS